MQQHDAASDAEVLEAEHVLSSKCENQQHFGSPDADSLELHQLVDDLLVGFLRQGVEIDGVVHFGLGNALEIFDFAGGQSTGAQIVKGGFEQIFGSNGIEQFFDAIKDGTGGFEGELLPDNALHQGKKRIARTIEGLHIGLLDQLGEFRRLAAQGRFILLGDFESHVRSFFNNERVRKFVVLTDGFARVWSVDFSVVIY